jgi:hypothetical protein
MRRYRTVDIQALAAEVVRRHSTPGAPLGRWDILARWRRRRYQALLVDAPLQQLRPAVARAERARISRAATRS